MKTLLVFWFHLLFSVNTTVQDTSVKYYENDPHYFFSLPEVNSPIDVYHPNYELLDAAVFHATNLERIKANVAPFLFDSSLYNAAVKHTESMVKYDFLAHDDPFESENSDIFGRIERYTKRFYNIAENIQDCFILDPPRGYCVARKMENEYQFYDCETYKPVPMLSYKEFAKACLKSWMNSSHHRHNILNQQYSHLACVGRIMPNPFSKSSGPYARLTQDFGGQ